MPTIPEPSPASAMLRQAVPAAFIGVAAGLMLIGFEGAVHKLEHLVWSTLPSTLGIATESWWWPVSVLGVAGLAVGAILHLVPGHGGHDPATTGLMAAPISVRDALGMVLASLVTLACGVSLGPEAALLGLFSAVLAVVAARRDLPVQGVVTLGMAGLIGALFGAPVGAAFAFVEMTPLAGEELYEKLVPLFVASSTGALSVVLVAGRPQLAIPLGAPRAFMAVDVVSAAVIGILGALAGLAIGELLRRIYPLALRVPLVARVTIGGLALGAIAAVTGELVLFSGQAELPDLLTLDPTRPELPLLLIGKILSLAIALAVGFRGGKIFPGVFVGVALGVLINGLVPGVPLALAVGAATVGVVLAFVRLWLLSLLMVALIVGIDVVPLLGVALIAAYFVVRQAPEVLVRTEAEPAG